MTLTGSGQISFNDIRVELNVPSQSPFTLGEASRNIYAIIQQCQTPFPSSTDPDAITEWYGYNHSATASLTINETTDYTSSNCTDACNALEAGNTTLQAYTRDSSNYYGNTTCTTGLTAGYYAALPRSIGCYTVAGSPASITLTACGSTTTTTTTTTLGTGTCYQTTNGNGSNPITVQWTDRTGTIRTGSLAASTTVYLCSITTPTQLPSDVDISVSTCTNAGATPCTITCTTIGCKQCADAGNCF